MPQYDAGTAGIRIKPNFTGFKTQAENELKAIQLSADVSIGADTAVAAAEIENLQRAARENQSFTVNANTLPARARLAALRNEANSPLTFTATIGGGGAAVGQVRRLSTQLRRAATVTFAISGVLGTGAVLADIAAITAAAAQAGKAVSLIPALGFGALAGGGAIATGASGIGGAFKAMTAATKEAGAAAADQGSRASDLADKQYQVSKSSREVRASQQNLADVYKQTSRSIRDMNLDLEDQQLAARDASLSVEEAAQRLTEVSFDPTADSTTRKRAQLSYDQAVSRMRQQQVQTQDLAEDTAEANARGVEGSREVEAARNQVTDAIHAQQQAIDALNESEIKASGGGKQDELEAALAKLSPSARRAVEDVRALGPAWTDARKASQEALSTEMGPAITRLADVQLTNLRDGFVGINTAINGGLRDSLRSLSSDVNKIDFRTSLTNTSLGFANAAEGAGPLTDSLTKLITVGSSFVPMFGQGMAGALGRFNERIQQGAADGTLRQTMLDGITATRELGSIAGNVGASIGSIFSAAAAGGPTLQSIDQLTERWREFLRSTEGQDILRKFFDEARAGAERFKPILQDLPEILNAIWDGFQAVSAVTSPLINAVTSLAAAQPELTSAVTVAVAAFLGFRAIGPLLGGIRNGIGTTSGALTTMQGHASSSVTALRNIATASGGVAQVAGVGATNLGRFGSAIQQAGTYSPAINGMQTAYLNAAAGADRFGRMAGTAAAAAHGMRTAASGVSSVLGGPWGIALAAATIGAIAISREVRKAADQQDILASSSRSLAISQREVANALQGTAGAVSEPTMAKLSDQITNVIQDNDRLAATAPGAFSVFTGGFADIKGWFSGVAQAGTDAVHQQEEIAAKGAAVRDSFKEIGLSAEEMSKQVYGSDDDFRAIVTRLEQTRNGGREAVGEITQLRQAFLDSQNAAKSTTPGFSKLYESIKVLSDSSKTGAERLNAMRDALDALSGKPVDAQKALAAYNEQVRATADLAASFDRSQGFGNQLISEDGTVNTTTANGDKLLNTLIAIKEKTLEVGVAGGDLNARLAQNAQQFKVLEGATGLEVKQIEGLAASIGLLPEFITPLVELQNADTTEQKLHAIALLIKANDGKPINVETKLLDDQARAALAKWGVDVQAVAGNPVSTTIAANTNPARAELDKFLADPKTLTLNVQIAKFAGKKITGTAVIDMTPGNATGGRLPTTGPGTERTDGFLGLARESGTPISWLDGGEWIVNRRSSDRYAPELAAINAGIFPKLPGYETGGRIGQGPTYGSVVEGMSAVVAAKFPGMQLTSGLRFTDDGYHSTGNAADFSNGSDSTPEMRGLAAYIAANFPQSLELIHSPFSGNIKNGASVGDGMSTYGASTMAEHRNHVHWAMATAPSIPSSAAPVPGSTTTPAIPGAPSVTTQSVLNPQADLPGRRTDTELQRLQGEAAVDAANSERNKVYADPAATDQDRLAADLKYQQAQNSLESASKKSDSTDLSLQGIFSKAGGILAEGILSGLGLENSILSSSNIYNRALSTTVDFYGKKNGQLEQPGGYAYQPKNLPSTVTTTTPAAPAIDPLTGELVAPPSSGVPQDAVKAAVAPAGWDTGSQWHALDQLVMHESSWNPDAQNPSSTAYGLFQFLDQTWATVGGSKTSDPYLQGVYGQAYIQQRYGTPEEAWSFWQAQNPHWYDQGGVASGVGLIAKNIIRPERTLSPHQTETFDSALPLLESINASAWASDRFSMDRFAAAPAAAVANGPDLSTTINARVASVDDLADLAERRQHVKTVGLMAAAPR
ncbi:transglycosylase SLT domain-containing protein [Nocardia sp. NPDC050697]|uniref:aggregation-promoting factor C-terminal-like domain-containing protein n=1 Tax=Nocardia sp. NPDC050697 TaxID=3155158 RepID=UPI0033C8D60C